MQIIRAKHLEGLRENLLSIKEEYLGLMIHKLNIKTYREWASLPSKKAE